MKKYIIYSLIMTLTCGLGACNNDEDVGSQALPY